MTDTIYNLFHTNASGTATTPRTVIPDLTLEEFNELLIESVYIVPAYDTDHLVDFTGLFSYMGGLYAFIRLV